MLLTASEIFSNQPMGFTDKIVEISRALEPGQEVQIIHGPFQGSRALVTRFITARERVEILIEWMGRTVRAEADVTDLKPLINYCESASIINVNDVSHGAWMQERQQLSMRNARMQ
jgi:hypothetical protein